MEAGSAILRVSDLAVSYGRVEAVHRISFSVAKAETVVLVGPNGAGKSTTLAAIAGILPAAAGSISFDGVDVTRRPAHARVAAGLCLVPEGRGLFADQSVHDNLLLGTYRRRRPPAEVHHDLEMVFARFPVLAERRGQLAGTLSGGEQQTLAIARALLARPTLLLLDEPSLGLAPRFVERIFALIAELRRDGVTVLLVEQMAARALDFADHALVMARGRIVLEGRGRELLGDPVLLGAYFGKQEPGPDHL